MSNPRDIEEAARRIRREKELKRAAIMMELALEKFVELEGVEKARDRLVVHIETLTWY